MDLWDVAKVMWRRRWVAVPLLLLSVVAAVFALLTVPPDYTVKGQIAVIPPSTATGAQAAGAAVNPFTVETLAELVAVYLNRAEVKRQMQAAALSPDYEITMKAHGLTLIDLTVQAKSVEQATRTVARLIDLVQREFQTRQSSFKLASGTEINTTVLDRGEEITVVRTVGKRTLIVIVGVGLLVTVGVSLWVDALIRRRQLRAPPMPPARFTVPMQSAPSPSLSQAKSNSAIIAAEAGPVDDRSGNDSTIALPLTGVTWTGEKAKRGAKKPQTPDA